MGGRGNSSGTGGGHASIENDGMARILCGLASSGTWKFKKKS